MCLFLFPDYEQVVQKLLNYGVNDKSLPLTVNEVKVQEHDWEFEKKLVGTLIPNQSRFMVFGRWLHPPEEDRWEDEGEDIPVLTGQVLPLWVCDNGSSGSRYRTWIGEERWVRVHKDHDAVRKVC